MNVLHARTHFFGRLLLAVLLMAILLQGSLVSAAYKREVVYAILDGEGALEKVIVVNHFELDEAGPIEDYGDYQQVERLVGEETLHFDGQKLTAKLPAGPWYYRGDLGADERFPWRFDLGYELDGEPIHFDDLAGVTGQLRLHIRVAPAPMADPKIVDAFLLQLLVSLPSEKVRSLQVDTGTVVEAGKYKQVQWMVLPGRTAKFALEAAVENFEMPGMQMAGVPMSMDLDALFEESPLAGSAEGKGLPGLEALSDGVKKLYTGASELEEGSAKVQGGLEGLEEGGEKLQGGATAFHEGLQAFAEGLTALEQQEGPLSQGFASLQEGVQTMLQGLQEGAASAPKTTDLSALQGLLDASVTELDQLAPLLALDLQPLVAAFEGLSALALPSIPSMDAERFAAQSHQGAQTKLLFERLASYAKQLPVNQQVNFTQNLQRLQVNVQAQAEMSQALFSQMEGMEQVMQGLAGMDPRKMAEIKAQLQSFAAFQAEMREAFPGIRQSLQKLQGQMAAFLESSEGGAAGEGLGALQQGLQGLADGLDQYQEGLTSYLGAVRTLKEGMQPAEDQEEQGILQGFEDLQTGLTRYQEGVAELAGGYPDFHEGLQGLKEGLATFQKESAKAQEGMDGVLDAALDKLMPPYEARSFVSDKNTEVEAIQFVIRTPSVHIEKETEDAGEAADEASFFTRFQKLFEKNE